MNAFLRAACLLRLQELVEISGFKQLRRPGSVVVYDVPGFVNQNVVGNPVCFIQVIGRFLFFFRIGLVSRARLLQTMNPFQRRVVR